MVNCTRIMLILTLLVAFASCATMPLDPEDPTLEEQPLVDRAEAWCRDAGYPAGVPQRPFFTDGCSGWIDGDLYGCCVEHDIAYWCGGTDEQRLEADRIFRSCAEENTPAQSGLVYFGVRMGGAPWLPVSWRWGYGHPYGTGYSDPKAPVDSDVASEVESADGAADLLESPQ